MITRSALTPVLECVAALPAPACRQEGGASSRLAREQTTLKHASEGYHPCEPVNLSTSRPKGRGLLEVHPEPCFPTPALKGGASHGRTGEWPWGSRFFTFSPPTVFLPIHKNHVLCLEAQSFFATSCNLTLRTSILCLFP
jgi:hypothetical protein